METNAQIGCISPRLRLELVTDVANEKDVGPDGLQGPLTRGTACGGVVMAPAGKSEKTKGGRRKVERAHEVLPCREWSFQIDLFRLQANVLCGERWRVRRVGPKTWKKWGQ